MTLQQGLSEAVRWTWPVTDVVADLVWDYVVSVYTRWGAAGYQADLLADLAVDFVTAVLEETPRPYVTVTVACDGVRATVSVIPAALPAPTAAFPLPDRDVEMATSWGRADLEIGLYLFAIVNLNPWRRNA
ncbi:hypothetical protein [Streptomyces sp. NBC_00140]|uniref:hypothetical protein n=1 Tax=Streptomyces sp. NBC_00140 TaxID=2975664 RepID=UPI0022535C67|nr:hypothetical protein [Streptomyces sp. NBC_00140]MCX5338293.1 hypothetical protein [Streptomyces sp. NBC_00140]